MIQGAHRRPARWFDATRPSSARVYDALLGGKNNFEADRAFVLRLSEIVPGIRDAAADNRAMQARALRYLVAEAGIRQFIDIGSGLPTAENTHQVAWRHAAGVRVAYVDNDPIVVSHGHALLTEKSRTAMVDADLRHPTAVLGHPALAELIDLTEPVGLLLGAVVHHVGDDEDPAGVVAAYLDALPTGSHLLLTHFCAATPDALEVEHSQLAAVGTGRARTLAEIEGFFAGLDLVAPGVAYLSRWRPVQAVDRPLTVSQRLLAGGVGRKR